MRLLHNRGTCRRNFDGDIFDNFLKKEEKQSGLLNPNIYEISFMVSESEARSAFASRKR
jgi:hypothetical protein